MPESTVTRRAARVKRAAQSANGDDRPTKARRRAKETVREPERAVENVRDTAEDATEATTDVVKGGSSGSGADTIREELTSIVREAALEVLTPVARKATLQAAKYAITQGPRYANENLPRLRDALDEAGGLGSAARSITAGLPERGRNALESRGIGRKKGESRKLPLQMSIDIAAPQDVTYEELAERLPEMKAFREGDIVDEERGVRLDWEGEPAATAVVTLHSLADDLTRVMVSYESGTGGVRGALGGGLIARSLRSDLRRLKADLEMGVAEDSDGGSDTSDEAPEAEERESRDRGGERRERKQRSSRRTKARAEEETEEEEPEGRAESDEDDEPEDEQPEGRAQSDENDEEDRDEAEQEEDVRAEADEDETAEADAETTRRKPVRRRAPARKRPTSEKASRETSRR